ncbi:spore germination protein [Brevibacillus borstelensis]|uniref:spore germination protein n=1 Tax=Brevibacillus borstelensis TaxID=45462 RepID=UPI00287F805E|nr:spore germination protein [Brevibacillus borstelensis]WNF06664.1 spore germination protein [Brevibacillus borstelensis]
MNREQKPLPSYQLRSEPALGVLENPGEDELRRAFAHCADVMIQSVSLRDGSGFILVYCEGLIDIKQMQDTILPELKEMDEGSGLDAFLAEPLPADFTEWTKRLFAGELLLFWRGKGAYSCGLSNRPQRSTEEANTEVSIKGPRDGFVEDLSANVALVRKRLRTTSLAYESFTLGTKSKTRVALLYMTDKAPVELIGLLRERLVKNESLEVVTSANLEKTITDNPYSIFPLTDYTGRPDYVTYLLLQGKAAILADNSPIALLVPSSLPELVKAPEDDQYPVAYIWLERVLRLFGIWLAIFLPGFWVALSAYNVEQFPFQLLATVSQGRKGLPFSSPIEMLGILFVFEFLREAGARLPKNVGQTLALVGGLIIGDASIRAGLTSPSELFIGSLTIVASFTLVNQSLSGAVTITRFAVFLLSSILGMYGFVISVIGTVLYLSTLSSFGQPYVLSRSPMIFSDLAQVLVRPLLSLITNKKRSD